MQLSEDYNGYDFGYEGDPPSADDLQHWDDIEFLAWSFGAVASPCSDPIFTLRHALSIYFNWKPKLPVESSDWNQLIDAVLTAQRAAPHRPQLYALHFIDVGLCGIIDTLEQRKASLPARQASVAYAQALRAEVGLHSALETVRQYDPKARLPAEYCMIESSFSEAA